MVDEVPSFEFSDAISVVGSDAIICVVRLSLLQNYMTLTELGEAFSGYAVFRQAPWMERYVGVWGRKNCQRFRRFLRERGADVVIHRERPPRLRLASYKKLGKRKYIRSLAVKSDGVPLQS